LKYAGEWEKEESLAELSLESISLKAGCEIFLKCKDDDSFTGSTLCRECPSSLHGASYATSEVKITDKQLISWDRGFDENGKQIWGAMKGGYIFDKLDNLPI